MSDALAQELSKASTGLVSAGDYKRKREELQVDAVLSKAKAEVLAAAPKPAGADEKKVKKKKKEKRPTGLSFDDELEEEEADAGPRPEGKKMAKNSSVDTSFLRQNSRDVEEAAVAKEQAMREFLFRQECAKDEKFSVSYTYRSEVTQREITNGVHRGTVELTRGMTAEEACKVVREDVHLLGGVHAIPSVAGIRQERDLVLIANATHIDSGIAGFVIPGAHTVFELCLKKWAEGDAMFDNSLSSGVIVTERRWYEAKRHTYPYIMWKSFDMRERYSYKEMISNRDDAKGGVGVPTHRDQLAKAKSLGK